MRCDVPLWRLMVQPVRSSAANARFAFVEGQFSDMFLGGDEGDVHWARYGFALCYGIREVEMNLHCAF